jgi:hypothetical protein
VVLVDRFYGAILPNYNNETVKLENYSGLFGCTWIQAKTLKRKENVAASRDAGEKEHPWVQWGSAVTPEPA